MPGMPQYLFQPEYQNGSRGRVFVQNILPASRKYAATCVIIPPFAEEMNRSRRTMALLGCALASGGYKAVIPDLYGSGDSEGGFGDARWDLWKADLIRTCTTEGAGHGLVVVGIRTGALLALELLEEVNVDRCLLIQPVTDGRSFLRQFMRLAEVGSMLGTKPARTVSDLVKSLQEGESVEVAGYVVHPELYSSLSAATLAQCIPNCPTNWFEINSSGSVPLMSGKVFDGWLDKKQAPLEIDVISDPPFWRTQEVSVGANVIENAFAVLTA